MIGLAHVRRLLLLVLSVVVYGVERLLGGVRRRFGELPDRIVRVAGDHRVIATATTASDEHGDRQNEADTRARGYGVGGGGGCRIVERRTCTTWRRNNTLDNLQSDQLTE